MILVFDNPPTKEAILIVKNMHEGFKEMYFDGARSRFGTINMLTFFSTNLSHCLIYEQVVHDPQEISVCGDKGTLLSLSSFLLALRIRYFEGKLWLLDSLIFQRGVIYNVSIQCSILGGN